jgi:CRISPR type III-A-associated RAMP protein Csm4
MQPAVLIRLRPLGPWRFGPSTGGSSRLDTLFRSDRLFSAVTLAMKQLGFLSEWLAATAESCPARVCFSSLYPFQGETLFVLPPATHWPPPASLVTSPSPLFLSKMRWSAARFIPLSLVESMLSGQRLLADQWLPDPESECLLRRDRPSSSPFRFVTRRGAAVDRLGGRSSDVHSVACVEFEPGAGLWTVVRFFDEEAADVWRDRVAAAFRLLCDGGFGGRRGNGWGQSQAPLMQEGSWPALLFPRLARKSAAQEGTEPGSSTQLYWLLSLFSPDHAESIDWSSGAYQLELRGGLVDSSVANPGAAKKKTRMIAEGSVLAASAEPQGRALDVAPDGLSHPVYRSGFALTLQLPAFVPQEPTVVEEPTDIDLREEPSEEKASEETSVDVSEGLSSEASDSDRELSSKAETTDIGNLSAESELVPETTEEGTVASATEDSSAELPSEELSSTEPEANTAEEEAQQASSEDENTSETAAVHSQPEPIVGEDAPIEPVEENSPETPDKPDEESHEV